MSFVGWVGLRDVLGLLISVNLDGVKRIVEVSVLRELVYVTDERVVDHVTFLSFTLHSLGCSSTSSCVLLYKVCSEHVLSQETLLRLYVIRDVLELLEAVSQVGVVAAEDATDEGAA